jgi:polysaccharide deacetylase family protein (PEP-CTERM system associated)
VSDPQNVFTVDLEEWFHVCGVPALRPEQWDRLPSRVELTTRRVLDLLDRAQVHATFFIVGWIAARYPHLVHDVLAAGHEVGSHSHTHQHVYTMDPEGFRADLRQSIQALTAAGARGITRFRAPEWSINDRSLWALNTLVEEGVTVDASMAPLKIVGSLTYPRYPHIRRTPSGPITEVPPLVADRFRQAMPMGWGWGLRMSSPRRVLRTIDAMNRSGHPAVLTVHPWELDPNPPRVRLPARLHFAHYFRLDGFQDRLRVILESIRFGRISEIATDSTTPAS